MLDVCTTEMGTSAAWKASLLSEVAELILLTEVLEAASDDPERLMVLAKLMEQAAAEGA